MICNKCLIFKQYFSIGFINNGCYGVVVMIGAQFCAFEVLCKKWLTWLNGVDVDTMMPTLINTYFARKHERNEINCGRQNLSST